MNRAITLGVFNIKNIEVIGNEVVDSEAIIDSSGINEGESIFWVDLNSAHYKIKELIDVEKLEIAKVMPDKIVIKIQEGTVIGAINFDGNVNYIGNDAVLIERSIYLKKTDIPIITGFTEIEIDKIGHPITVKPDWKFDTVMTILNVFQKDGNLAKISEIGTTAENTYKIISKNNVVFEIKDIENFNTFYDYICTVLSQNKNNMDINLTAGNNPIMKPR
ncbi:MAG: FtsQ-type POTRA domain-containing protein [Eubacterium sp.]